MPVRAKINDDPFAISAELPGVDNLSAIQALNKQEEEVQKFIENGHLAPAARTVYVLEHGSVMQKTAVLQHLPQTVVECNDADVSVIVRELNELWKQDAEVQVVAGPAVVEVLPKLKPKHVGELQEGVRTMIEISNETVRREWCTVLVECVPYLPQTEFEIVTDLAIRKTDTCEQQVHRTMGCRVLGGLAQRFDSAKIEKTFLKHCMSLCQDVDVEVRVAMCNQLNVIARAIGLGLTKQHVTQELLELLVDEEKIASRAAFTALIDLIDFFDAPYRREQVYPILKHYISSPPEDVLSLLIEEFGRFIYKIRGDVNSPEDIALFGGFFVQCAQKQDPNVRRLCAYNLPAVVASLPSSFFVSSLQHTLKSLSQDTHVPTRIAIASGLHELCGLLNDKAAGVMQECFLMLISDKELVVQEKTVAHLDVFLAYFTTQITKAEDREHLLNSVIQPIVQFEAAVKLRWRNFRVLFEHFELFPKYFKPEHLHDIFIPILFRHIAHGASTLKPRCAYLIIHFTRFLPQSAVVEIFRRINTDLGKSPTYTHRVSYLEVCFHAMQHFSRKFTRDRLLEMIWELSRDPVSHVRMRCAELMPQVKKILKPPVDVPEYMTQLQSTVSRLLEDEDVEVRHAIQEAQPRLDDLERKFAKYTQAMAKGPKALAALQDEDDIADKKREETEDGLLEAAREVDRQERRQKLRELLKSEREADEAPPLSTKSGSGMGGRKIGERHGSHGSKASMGIGGSASKSTTSGTTSTTTKSTISKPTVSSRLSTGLHKK
eukprot:PhM_4_TR11917/c0_g1_i1/m.80111/K15426/PPP4R4; serine/threonine-protein phosphatase 4 regulatory subunit 4